MGKSFWALFWTQFLGALNDNLLKNALVMLVTFKGVQVFGLDSKSLVAAAGGVFILPFFLFSSTAGQLSDKFQKAKIVRWTKYWELLVMFIAALGFYLQSFEMLLIVLFFMGLQSTFFGPVKYSILPEILSRSALVKGNAYVEMGTFLAILMGTIIGGWVVSFDGGEWWIISLLILVSVSGIFFSKGVNDVPLRAKNLKIDINPFKPLGKILKLSTENRTVFNAILGISWFWFFGAGVLSLLPVYGKDVLQGNQEVVTAFLAVFTLGIGLGSMICEKLSFERVEIGLVPIGSLGMTIFLADLYFIVPSWTPLAESALGLAAFWQSPDGPRILFDFFSVAVFGGIFIVPLYTLIQERSPEDSLSRVIAANNIMNALFMVVSALFLMGLYALELSVPEIFLSSAVLNLIVSIYIYTIVPEFTLRFFTWVLVHCIYRLRITGEENIPKNGAALLICNHISFVDWLIISGAVKRPIRFIMYYKFMEIPIARYFFKQAKVIPISSYKENPEMVLNAFKTVSQELKNGELVCIFPEGAISNNGELNEFKPGIERIIEQDAVPVIPMAICGLWGGFFTREGGPAMLKRPKRLWHRIELKIAKPVEPQKATAEALQKIVHKMLVDEKS